MVTATTGLNLNPNQFVSGNQSFTDLVKQVGNNNGLGNLHTVKIGQVITLPDGSTDTVQKGDTLSGIVDRWKKTTEQQNQPAPIVEAPPPATNNEPPAPNTTPETNDENAATTETATTEPLTVDSPSNGSNTLPPIRSNPLSAFSSSTYNISLYMINPDTYNKYVEGNNSIPSDWKLICRSGGINNTSLATYENDGSSSGTTPRAEGFELDCYIDNLRISTAISSKETMAACNSYDFSFQIHEPYGFSLPTRLVKAATKIQKASKIQRNVNESITALQTHYLLVIRFYGYDKDGKLVTSNDYPMAEKNTSDPSAIFERSFPLLISAFDFKLDPKMVTYNIKAKLVNELSALGKEKLEIRDTITVKGETVQDVLQGSDDDNKNPDATGLMQRLNEMQQKKLDAGEIEVKDIYKIKFEPNTGIDKAFLVDVENSPLEKSANTDVSNADGVNVKTSSQPAVIKKRVRPITINKGDSILQAIDQIISQSSYVTKALKITTSEEYQQVKDSDEDYTKNTPSTIGWYTVIPQVKLLDFDNKRNLFASEITYIIKRYEVPYIRGLQLGKRTPYYGPVKRYKHWFMSDDTETGTHEKEIISYDVTYNLLYFNLGGTGSDYPLTETDDPAPVANLSGGTNPTGKAPGYFDKAISPFKTFLYSPADQLKAKVVILGDPDYLMTSTTKGYEEAITKWFGTDQSINPNSGQVFIEIEFRDAVDYASPTDKQGAGLLNPSQDGDILFWNYPESIKKKIQGVVYMVWHVVSTFNKGVFQQELKVCIPPFVGDTKEADTGEGRFNSASLNPNGTNSDTAIPTGFDSIMPPVKDVTAGMSPATFSDVASTAGLKIDTLGPLRTTIPPENPTGSFNIANDDKVFAVNNPIDEGGREA